jgi:trimeric autotransporter adhesin
MSVAHHRTCLAWYSMKMVASLAGVACGAPLLDVDPDDAQGEMGGVTSQSPDAGSGGLAGTFPNVPLPAIGADGGASGADTPLPVGVDPGVAGAAGTGGAAASAVPAGSSYVLTSSDRLLLIDPDTGATLSESVITGLDDADVLVSIDFRPADRLLYALARSGSLYRIDASTGVATALGPLAADVADTSAPYAGLEGASFGIDFNPVVDRLRVVSDAGQNLRINVDTGKVITDTPLQPATPSVSAAAYGNAFAAACRTRLYGVDTATGQLVLVDPPNDGKLTPIGALGISAAPTGSAAFDVYTSADGIDRASLLLEVDSAPTLFDVNLGTGAATAPRRIELEPGESVLGFGAAPPLSAPAQAPGELLGMTESQRIVSFNRAAPAKLCTSAAVNGLAPNERVLGLDVRPSDGALYALGSAGDIYTLDVASGVATRRALLMADPNDTTDPYTGLTDTDYGAGFNPVPDRLRAIGSAGQNLRIDVDSGATFTDSPIADGAGIGAVAYANAFAGAKSTTLFGVDTSGDVLVRVGGDPATGGACPTDLGNPNCGVITSIGPLGQDATSIVGFDIDGTTGSLGSALLALSPAGATSSSLLVVDLETGAAAAPAGLANPTIGGGERISALTLARNPELTAYAVTSDGQLLTFSPRTPERIERAASITQLYDGEVLIGVDLRPADGLLYAVGNSGRLYTIDVASGAATQLAALTPAAADDSPFSGFDARASHGLDFNPTADLLRIVSDWGQNLRLVPSPRHRPRLPLGRGQRLHECVCGCGAHHPLCHRRPERSAGAPGRPRRRPLAKHGHPDADR